MLPRMPARASAFAIIAVAVAGLLGLAALDAGRVRAASTFPDRAVKFIVPVPPGPLLDMLPRMLGE
jgi:tripartite-type tricarboxylate transporter receptor subunit TctC